MLPAQVAATHAARIASRHKQAVPSFDKVAAPAGTRSHYGSSMAASPTSGTAPLAPVLFGLAFDPAGTDSCCLWPAAAAQQCCGLLQ